MREDVLSYLDRYNTALLSFLERFESGELNSDVIYQKNLLVYVIKHYIHCLDFYKSLDYFSSGPERVFVFLPGNVPVVPFQLLPLFLISGVREVYFKYSRREKSFYDNFIDEVKKHLGGSLKLEGAYLDHVRAFEKAKGYDFVVGFGGIGLQKVFEDIKIPYRFFGPKFSIGVVVGKPTLKLLDGIAWDCLSFDTRGCLSLSVVFVLKWDIREELWQSFERVSKILPPESDFSMGESEYEVYRKFQFFEEIRKGKDYLLVFGKNFVEFSAPRTIQVVEVDSMREVVQFIKFYEPFLQGIATDSALLPKDTASFITEFGKLQFTPCSWFFEKGVNYKNFWEV